MNFSSISFHKRSYVLCALLSSDYETDMRINVILTSVTNSHTLDFSAVLI